MTTTNVQFGDSTRQAALFETMILAAAADGAVDKVELQEIYRRVFERPEFHGIHADDLKVAIEHAARRVAEAHSLEHIVLRSSIASRTRPPGSWRSVWPPPSWWSTAGPRSPS